MLKKTTVKIAIVEDDLFFNKSLTRYVQTICEPEMSKGLEFEIKSYLTADEAIQELEEDLDVMLLDFHLFDPYSDEELNGTDVFHAVQKHCTNCQVVMISDKAKRLIKEQMIPEGLTEFVNKDINSKNRIGAILQEVFKLKR